MRAAAAAIGIGAALAACTGSAEELGATTHCDPVEGAEVLACEAAWPKVLALAGERVFWSGEGGGIFAVDDDGDGGQLARVYDDGRPHPSLLADDEAIYTVATKLAPRGVVALDHDGGDQRVVFPAYVGALSQDERALYWASDGGAMRVPKSGGTPEPIAGTEGARNLVVHGGAAYWTRTPTTPAELLRTPLAGGATEVVARGVRGRAFTVVEGRVYVWTNACVSRDGGWTYECEGTLSREPGGAVFATDEAITGAAEDGDRLYVLTRSRLLRMSLEGRDVETLASGFGGTAGLMLDEAHVHWLEQGVFTDAVDAVGRVLRRAR